MLEYTFKKSRFLVLVIVFISFLASLILYVTAINIIGHQVYALLDFLPNKPSDGQILAVSLLKSLDILLIAFTFQIVAIACYRLFIANNGTRSSRFMNILGIHNFHQLKINILQVIMLILVILFAEQAVEVGANLNTFLYGSSIALVIWAINVAIKSLLLHHDHESPSQDS